MKAKILKNTFHRKIKFCAGNTSKNDIKGLKKIIELQKGDRDIDFKVVSAKVIEKNKKLVLYIIDTMLELDGLRQKAFCVVLSKDRDIKIADYKKYDKPTKDTIKKEIINNLTEGIYV